MWHRTGRFGHTFYVFFWHPSLRNFIPPSVEWNSLKGFTEPLNKCTLSWFLCYSYFKNMISAHQGGSTGRKNCNYGKKGKKYLYKGNNYQCRHFWNQPKVKKSSNISDLAPISVTQIHKTYTCLSNPPAPDSNRLSLLIKSKDCILLSWISPDLA